MDQLQQHGGVDNYAFGPAQSHFTPHCLTGHNSATTRWPLLSSPRPSSNAAAACEVDDESAALAYDTDQASAAHWFINYPTTETPMTPLQSPSHTTHHAYPPYIQYAQPQLQQQPQRHEPHPQHQPMNSWYHEDCPSNNAESVVQSDTGNCLSLLAGPFADSSQSTAPCPPTNSIYQSQSTPCHSPRMVLNPVQGPTTPHANPDTVRRILERRESLNAYSDILPTDMLNLAAAAAQKPLERSATEPPPPVNNGNSAQKTPPGPSKSCLFTLATPVSMVRKSFDDRTALVDPDADPNSRYEYVNSSTSSASANAVAYDAELPLEEFQKKFVYSFAAASDQPSNNDASKPDLSYANLIMQAISASVDGRLTLKEIYRWIPLNYPYFKTAPPAWHNSIRHNLSLHRFFTRVPRPCGKGAYWTVDPEAVRKHELKGIVPKGSADRLCLLGPFQFVPHRPGLDTSGSVKGRRRARSAAYFANYLNNDNNSLDFGSATQPAHSQDQSHLVTLPMESVTDENYFCQTQEQQQLRPEQQQKQFAPEDHAPRYDNCAAYTLPLSQRHPYEVSAQQYITQQQQYADQWNLAQQQQSSSLPNAYVDFYHDGQGGGGPQQYQLMHPHQYTTPMQQCDPAVAEMVTPWYI